MPGRLPRQRLSDQPVICKKCGREFKGEAMKQPTGAFGRDSFYRKPASIPNPSGEEVWGPIP
jgi:hypothetical protein